MASMMWTANYTQINVSAGKNLISLWNGVGSTKVIRVYRVFASNGNVGPANMGMLSSFIFNRISAHSGGNIFSPVPMDTGNTALDANVVAATGAACTFDGKLKTWLWTSAIPAVTDTTFKSYELLYSHTCLWDVGYSDSRLQPITLRAGQGVCISNLGSNSCGVVDFWIEFSQDSS